MKKALFLILTVLVIVAAVVAVYRFSFRKSIPDASASEQVLAILQQNDCFVCHSSDQKLPFYASFPVVGKMVKEHARHAVDFVNLGNASFQEPTEVLLSMLEYSVTQGNMPLTEYSLIHWGTGFNRKEKSVVASWVQDMRAELYASGLSSSDFAGEPVQVLPPFVPVNKEMVALGQKMYNDTRISLDNTISCASCHILAIGGADEDDERTSKGIYDQLGGVNAPTVYNSVFNVKQFWNGRAADLKEQAGGPPENPVEMGDQTWAQIVERLSQDKGLVAEFKKVFPDEGLTQSSVTEAIAEYEKTLLTPGSRFDKYLSGDKEALTETELAGYYAFKNNSCATCHVGKILGGQSFEKLGIFEDYYADRQLRAPEIQYISDDDGLKSFTGEEADLHKFKTPMLRNVALTPPYFHDGSYATLEDAVTAMYRFELGRQPEPEDLENIVLFLGTLTGQHKDLETTCRN